MHGKPGTLALTDPDSNFSVPRVSPRFAGDFMLDSQGDQQLVFMHRGDSGVQLRLLNLTQSVDHTVWATASDGTLSATDGKTIVYAIGGQFDVGTAFSAVTPANANNAPPNPGPNYLATLNLNTGVLTATPGVTIPVKGLVFVARGEGEDS